MDLSNINKGPERWNNKRKGSNNYRGDKSTVTCYGCGKTGHYARNCCIKNKVTRQLNMLAYNDHSDQEWEVVTSEMGRLMEDPTSGPNDDYIEDSDEDATSNRIRSPTPYLCVKWIRNDPRQYHVVECDTRNDSIIVGKRHYGPFYQQNDKYYSKEGKRLLVCDKIQED
jgi:hypothetical protein